MDPERAHHWTLTQFRRALGVPLLGSSLSSAWKLDTPELERELMGLNFPNPVGLAAGFDKNAEHIDLMHKLGFGFIEIGTVTPRAQAGNPQPRLFRLPADEALINRMGFNNAGVEAAVKNLKKSRPHVIIGGNIGKNKTTENSRAVDDYLLSYKALHDYVDYFVINVSSPNTPGLRELQRREPLLRLLSAVQELNQHSQTSRPILLKVAPDITDLQREDIAEVLLQSQMTGLITCNTTISRDGLHTSSDTIAHMGAGGLSGAPLYDQSLRQLRWFRSALPRDMVIIGVGGINSPERAAEMLAAGADLIQIYSALIYEGPALIKKIKHHLLAQAH